MRKIFTILCAALLSVSAFAELAYNATFTQSDFNNSSTVVGTAAGETVEWDEGEGAVRCGGTYIGIIGGPGYNWNDKYFDVKLAAGVPNKLTFQYRGNDFASTQVLYFVQESVDGVNWTDTWSIQTQTTSYKEVSCDLLATTRYMRFCWSGNFAGYFKDIKVTEKILMGTPNPDSLNFGTVKVDDVVEPQAFTIGWTNLEGTAVSSDQHFTVSPETFGTIGLFSQKDTFQVALNTGAAGTFEGTITVEGRGKSDSVKVFAVVEKHNQTINWTPAASVNYGDAVVVATATSGLAVSYEIADPSVLVYENGAFRTVHGGTTNVTAKQVGNYKYNAAANVVKTITVVPPTLYGEYEVATCGEPVEFDGELYTESADVNVGVNYLGGDSIVHLTVIIKHPTTSEESMTIVYGAQEIWNGINLGDSTVGTHTVVYTTTNFAGCDSVVTLNLTVTKQSVVDETIEMEFCDGDSAEFRGVWYKNEGNYPVYVEGEVSDTLYTVAVTVNLPESTEDSYDKYAGDSILFEEEGWLLRDETPVVGGLYVVTKADTANLWFIRHSTTEKGCDATYELSVNVELLPAVELEQDLFFCPGESVEYRDIIYWEEGKDTILVEDEVRDTVIFVNITTLEIVGNVLYDTVAAGDAVKFPEGEWYLGETRVESYTTSEEDVPELKFIQNAEIEGCEVTIEFIVTVTSREGVENVFADKSAEKFFRNGVLYIRRGDAVYTATGERVE